MAEMPEQGEEQGETTPGDHGDRSDVPAASGAAEIDAPADGSGEPGTGEGTGSGNAGQATGRRRWPWVAAIGAALVIGGGAWAFNAVLGGGGPQPAEVLPASTAVYFRIDLDPSAGQKLAALRLADRFPALEDLADDLDDDLKMALVDAIGDEDTEFAQRFDYEDDFEPWLGDRIGFGVVLDDPDEPTPLVVIQVTDRDAASATLSELMAYLDAEDADPSSGYAFSGDYVVIAPSQELAERAVADAEAASLADSELFTEVHEGLGDPGVASMWIGADLDELLGGTFTAQAGDGVDAIPASLAAAADPELRELTMAAVLRLDASHIEVVGQAIVDSGSMEAVTTAVGADLDAAAMFGRLPATTLLGVTLAGVDLTEEQRQEAWDQLMAEPSASGFDPEQLATDLEEETGISLPDDLFDLLGNDITLAVDASILDIDDPSGPSDFPVALVFDVSGDAGEEAVTKLVDLIEGSGLGLAVDSDGETVVIALSDGYLAELTGVTEVELLSDTGAAARALGSDGPVSVAMFFDMGGLVGASARGGTAIEPVPDEVLENLAAIDAVGLTMWSEDRGDALPIGHFSLRLTLTDD